MNPIQRLATFVAGRRTKWLTLVFWLIVVAIVGSLAGKLNGAEKNDSTAWLPSGAESTQVLNLWNHVESPNILPAVVVYDRPGGLTAADKAKAQADVTRFHDVAGVIPSQIYGPFTSTDNQAIETTVAVNLGSGWNNAGTADDALRDIAQSGADGLTVHIAGQLGYASDSDNAFKGISSTLLYAALAVVIVLLLLTYRSPVLWLLPVLSVGAALGVAEGLVYLLAVHTGLTVNAQSAGILDVLVFGVGTDYALLLTARYREELHRHADRHLAMAVALRRAGPAVVASAGTVAISLLALTLAELNSTKSMGPVLAIGVVVALAAMTTLLPALLVITGRWVFWPSRPVYDESAEPQARGLWTGIGRRIAVHPRWVWITTAIVLGVLAIGLTGLKASGLTNAQSLRGHPDSVVGQTVLDQHFPGGIGSSVQVTGTAAAAPRIATTLASVPGLTEVGQAGDRGRPRVHPGDADLRA
jgi:putative drug exporter of the RND superfamily